MTGLVRTTVILSSRHNPMGSYGPSKNHLIKDVDNVGPFRSNIRRGAPPPDYFRRDDTSPDGYTRSRGPGAVHPQYITGGNPFPLRGVVRGAGF